MRTTLSLDDDVLAAARERARRERRTLGEVVSDLARAALVGQVRGEEGSEMRNGFPVLPRHGQIVTRELVEQLLDEAGD